jgi:starch phosphorylase
MKLAMNGALTIGTLDGANIEIRDRAGAENFFLFGHDVEQIQTLMKDYSPGQWLESLPILCEAMARLEAGEFSGGDRDLYHPLLHDLRGRDPYAVIADFSSYCETQQRVDEAWRDQALWQSKSILTTARSGYFSSDRAIRTYAEEIWKVQPVPISIRG